jgi:large subunit ribosomal protein L6e
VLQIDISKVKVPANLNDAFFAKKVKGKGAGFFDKEAEGAKKVTPERAEAQKAVDAGIITAIKATPLLNEYLRSLFTLRNGQFPHEMKF